MTNVRGVAEDAARTRLMSLPNTGLRPGSSLWAGSSTIPIQREELSSAQLRFHPDWSQLRPAWPGPSGARLPSGAGPAFPLHFVSVCGFWPEWPLLSSVSQYRPGPALPPPPPRLYAAPGHSRNGNTEQSSFLALDCVFLMCGLWEGLWTNHSPGDEETWGGGGGHHHHQSQSHLEMSGQW